MARLTPDAVNEPFKRPREFERGCAQSGCAEEGLYPAPLSRDRLREYKWFCLEHIREYNKAWDFFAGMKEDEIEAQRRFDTVWNRPSWRVGAGPKGFGDIHDGFGFFNDGGAEPPRPRQRPQTEEDLALAELELQQPVAFDEIKARYIELVKRLHPDANGGNPDNEERLKRINEAYAKLRRLYA
jgi:hypothetical protein